MVSKFIKLSGYNAGIACGKRKGRGHANALNKAMGLDAAEYDIGMPGRELSEHI